MRSMIHPYYGELVVCADLLGDQHDAAHTRERQTCWECDWPIQTCVECKVNIECCPCGQAHAYECPWPL